MVLVCKTEMVCLALATFCVLCNSYRLDSETEQKSPGVTETDRLPSPQLLTFEVSPLERLEGLMRRGGRHKRSTLIEFTVPLAIRITGRGKITVDINAINLDDGSLLEFRIDPQRSNITLGSASLEAKECGSSTNSGCAKLTYDTPTDSRIGTDRIFIIVEDADKKSNYVEENFMVETTNPSGQIGSEYFGDAPYSPADEGQNWQIAAALLAASTFILICAIINIWCCMEFDHKPEEEPQQEMKETPRGMTSSHNPHFRQRYDSIWRREAVRDGRADGSLTPMPYYGERRNSTRLTAFVDPETERRTPAPSVVQGSFYNPSQRGSTAGTQSLYDRRFSAVPPPQVMTINYDPIPEDDSPGYTPPPVTSRSVRTSWTSQPGNGGALNSPVGRPRSNSLSPSGRRHRRVSALSADIEAFKKVPWDQISSGRASLTSGYV
ncbi:Hypp6377 [Branchiostoma lanceolatum]|uniref:Hypp6377 protein n=1 Tax=Branchiostoma lanceolatum TaxID=7740 RepID=A0A8J9YTQ8_BRALA|nr:Hypp6377 [Branchiostoma lanceolatum]